MDGGVAHHAWRPCGKPRDTTTRTQNLLEKAPEVNLGPLMDNKLLNLCNVLSARKWTDEDILADLEMLTTELQKNAHELTYGRGPHEPVLPGTAASRGTCLHRASVERQAVPVARRARSFEEYAAEVRSSKLEWSPMHRSDAFWKLNSQRLNEQNYELLRILARLLSTSTDPIVLSIAAHDIGEYVTANPRGKRIVQELGAKQRIMELMNNENATVRYEALLSTQKFMVNNWYVGAPPGARGGEGPGRPALLTQLPSPSKRFNRPLSPGSTCPRPARPLPRPRARPCPPQAAEHASDGGRGTVDHFAPSSLPPPGAGRLSFFFFP